MRAHSVLIALLILALPSGMLRARDSADALKSRAERTNYEETSRYDDVMHFIAALQRRSDLVRVEIFGTSQEGRALPLLILSDPPISQPRDVRSCGKPVVFIMANIHAGEVEGKEATLHLARRLLLGELRPLLGKLVILLAPIYNADGNEKFGVQHRTQYGPIGGAGVRQNARGLDLNRDFMKLEAPETQGLVRLFDRWDPHITVDLHTTNGTYHAYHLTYSIPLNPSTDPRIVSYERQRLMPALTAAMLQGHKFRTYYYGDIVGPVPKPGQPETRFWRAFSHLPRVGTNYVGLRNRLSILSEAYSYLHFRRRIEVTEAFVEEIFRYAAEHAGEITQLTRRVDEDTIQEGRAGNRLPLGVENVIRPLPEPVEILLGAVTKIKNPRTGKDMTAVIEDKVTPIRVKDFGTFEATRTVLIPRAYLFRAEAGMQVVVEKLLEHGIAVEELTQPSKVSVEGFAIGGVTHTPGGFMGPPMTQLRGQYKPQTMDLPAGSYIVRAAQPLARLAAYLLEPESDDGITSWKAMDEYLAAGKVYPIYKAVGDVEIPCRLVQKLPESSEKRPAVH